MARLARLVLSAEEETRLAGDLRGIAEKFADLASYADGLPDAPVAEAGPVREDVAEPASLALADDIVSQAPHVDAATRLVRVPRAAQDD